MLLIATALFAITLVSGGCPYLEAEKQSSYIRILTNPTLPNNVDVQYATEYTAALSKLDWVALRADITASLTTSQSFWPADWNGNYGPFMIRQAWHCAGSYRISDGRGGCDGGRQRFDPERSWNDNTNLNQAKQILWPIKQKYGLGLSWGDLIIFTANVAIENMGGPVLGFCAGRIDEPDGSWSTLLGPTAEQAATYPCPINGQCESPLGSTTIGLIYVNPEGPMGVPNPVESAPQVRDVFGRMAMNDSETVALIGGGHAFGKTHGACPNGTEGAPNVNPLAPWKGLCGSGIGADTFTSGFEGPWVTTPTKWGNQYFNNLLSYKWSVGIGPGGHNQWSNPNVTSIMMLTTDISLLNDPSYLELVKLFASDLNALDVAFSNAWYKLTTRDMGPYSRCVGPNIPPPQPFQYPLPSPPSVLPEFDKVKSAIASILSTSSSTITPDIVNGHSNYGPLFVYLAYQCASTFRVSDYLGGCNGARIRFSPQTSWRSNTAMNLALDLLQPVKTKFGSSLSWSDLIVLAGNVALENAGASSTSFCGGRTDAQDGVGSQYLSPNGELFLPQGNYSSNAAYIREQILMLGLTNAEYVALSGRPRSVQQYLRIGYTVEGSLFNNSFFVSLINENWQPVVTSSGLTQYKAVGKNLFMLPSDIVMKQETDFLAISMDFASNNTYFQSTFLQAWNKLMNLDRFNGPSGNVCDIMAPSPSPSPSPSPLPADNTISPALIVLVSVLSTMLVMSVIFFLYEKSKRRTTPLLSTGNSRDGSDYKESLLPK